MQNEIEIVIQNNLEAKVFDMFRRGKKIPIYLLIIAGFKSSIREIVYFIIKNFPGPFGMQIRRLYFGLKLKKLGRNCLIDEGVRIEGLHNISISDYVWVDRYVSLYARFGHISIGKRVHVAPYSLISGGGGVYIGDYVGIAPGVKIYSHSESPRDGKRMSGPMIPEEYEGQVIKPVRIEKDAFIGANAVILPGVTIGEGAVVAANSLVTSKVEPYDIVMGVPARPCGKRKKVRVPDI